VPSEHGERGVFDHASMIAAESTRTSKRYHENPGNIVWEFDVGEAWDVSPSAHLRYCVQDRDVPTSISKMANQLICSPRYPRYFNGFITKCTHLMVDIRLYSSGMFALCTSERYQVLENVPNIQLVITTDSLTPIDVTLSSLAMRAYTHSGTQQCPYRSSISTHRYMSAKSIAGYRVSQTAPS
jgi:hypothetical protein